MMNNSFYFVRSREQDRKVKAFIERYNLSLCYNRKKEKILKNEDCLVLLKKKYIFLHTFSENTCLNAEIKSLFKASEVL